MADFQLSSNAAQVGADMHRAANELRQLEDTNSSAGAIIAAAPAPHRLGRLAASVRADVSANGVTVAGHTDYWTFVHWGAPRIHVVAQPWLLNQLDAKQSDIIELYRDHASDALAHIGD